MKEPLVAAAVKSVRGSYGFLTVEIPLLKIPDLIYKKVLNGP